MTKKRSTTILSGSSFSLGTNAPIRRVLLHPTVWAIIGYTLLIAALALPTATHITTRLIGNNIDNWVFYWNDWWLEQAIANGHNVFYTPYLFHPDGTSLVAHSNSFVNSALAFPLIPYIGQMGAHNLVLLGGLWLGAVGMFLLVRDITTHSIPALIAGMVFTLAPYHLTQALAHDHLGSIHWWPLTIWCLRRFLSQNNASHAPTVGGLRYWAICAGVFAALTVWTGLHLAILLGIWTALYLAWHWRHTVHNTRNLALFTLCAILLSLPLLVPILQQWSDLATVSAVYDEALIKQTDLLAYLTPPTYHPLWGNWINDTYETFVVNRAFMPYIGYCSIVLIIYSLRQARARFWLATAALWLILSLGSALRVNGIVFDTIPLPYQWLGKLFPISAIRAPDRFNLLLVLSTSVLVGIGAASLWRSQKWRWLLLPVTIGLLLEYWIAPLPMWEAPPYSPFFDELDSTETHAVIDYPMGYSQAKLWLYYQTLHGKPTVEGHLSRYTDNTYSFIARNPLLSHLYQAGERPDYLSSDFFDSPRLVLGEAIRGLLSADIQILIHHTTYSTNLQKKYLHDAFPLIPIYRDDVITAYDLSRPRPYWYGTPPIPLAPSIVLHESISQIRDENLSVQMLLQTETETPPPTCVWRWLKDGSSVSEVKVAMFPTEVNWQPHDLHHHTLTQPIPPLATQWQLQCADNPPYTFPDTIVLSPTGRVLTRHALDTTFADTVHLTDYRWWTDQTALTITTRWQATAPITANAKIFIHLLDSSGQRVRQYDAIPCQWQCPTTQWEVDEIYTDHGTIDLWGLQGGTYTLAVGLYDAESGERLQVGSADNALILPDPIQIGE